MGLCAAVQAIRRSGHLIDLGTLPRSTLAPIEKLKFEKISGFVLQLGL
jgi:hypothetical protein